MLQLNYKLTDEDYIEFNEFHQLIHSEIGKRNLFFLRLIGPMISILAMIIFILARVEVMLIIGEAIVLFIFSVVEILLAKKIMKRGIRKTILKMKEKEGLPFTFIIVGIMGYVVGAMTEKHDQYGWKVAAIFAAFVIKIVGYYIAEIILYGNFIAPISSVPGNVVQIAVAAVVVLIVIEPIEIAVKKIGITQFA